MAFSDMDLSFSSSSLTLKGIPSSPTSPSSHSSSSSLEALDREAIPDGLSSRGLPRDAPDLSPLSSERTQVQHLLLTVGGSSSALSASRKRWACSGGSSRTLSRLMAAGALMRSAPWTKATLRPPAAGLEKRSALRSLVSSMPSPLLWGLRLIRSG